MDKQNKRSIVSERDKNISLNRSVTYSLDGKAFIVTPVFRQDTIETLGSVLLKLMKSTPPQ